MEYLLINAKENDINKLNEYKLDTVLRYNMELEKERIINYVKQNIPKQLNDYKLIKLDNTIIGCVLVYEYDDGVLIDEIYIERHYRNQGIGTEIIKKILTNNKKVYLYVYKDNIKAYNLYKSLGFSIRKNLKDKYFLQYIQ